MTAMAATTHFSEIRVFISSTFSDMDQERNYLIKKIFPDIQRECRRRNIVFTPLDLRWGITEEESKSGRVVEICMEEIERTKPFFIGLIGGRYGWVPQRGESGIDIDALVRRFPWIEPYIDSHMSITEMEMQFGVLANPDPVHAHFFIRKDRIIPKKFRETDPDKEHRRRELKKSIYSAAHDGRCMVSDYTDMKSLGRVVHEQLMAMIEEIAPPVTSGSVYELYYIEQQRKLSELRSFYVAGKNGDPVWNLKDVRAIVYHGAPGCGLSAYLANEVPEEVYIGVHSGDDKPALVIHTIVDENVSTLERVKRMFIISLMHRFPDIEVPEINMPEDDAVNFEDIVRRFPETPLLWIIDGVEKLPEEEQSLAPLLRESVPVDYLLINVAGEKLVESIKRASEIKIMDSEFAPLSPLMIRDITDGYLARYGKRLVERQVTYITGSRIFSSVKMLRNFLDVVIQFGDYSMLDRFIGQFTTLTDRSSFYDLIIARIEEDFTAETIRRLLGRLMFSFYGIEEGRLMQGVVSNPVERAALFAAIMPYCSNTQGLIRLNDPEFRHAAKCRMAYSEAEIREFRRYIVAEANLRMRELKRGRPFDVMRLFSVISRGMCFFNGMAEGYLASMTHLERLCQYMELDNPRRVSGLLSHMGYYMGSNVDMTITLRALQWLYSKGRNVLKLFDSLDLWIEEWLMDGFHIWPMLSWGVLADDPDRSEKVTKRFNRLWITTAMRERILKGIGAVKVDLPIDELWDENDLSSLESYEVNIIINDGIMTVLMYDSRQKAEAIYDKAAKTIDRLEQDEEELSGSIRYIAMLRMMGAAALRMHDNDKLQHVIKRMHTLENGYAFANDIRNFELLGALLFNGDIKKRSEDYMAAMRNYSMEVITNPFMLFARIFVDPTSESISDIACECIAAGAKSAAFNTLVNCAKILYCLEEYKYAAILYRVISEANIPCADKGYHAWSAASSYESTGNYEEGLVVIDKLEKELNGLSQLPNYRSLLSMRSSLLSDVGRYDEAIAAADMIISTSDVEDKSWLETGYNRKSVALGRKSDTCDRDSEEYRDTAREGMEFCRLAYELNPSSCALWGNYVNAVLRTHEFDTSLNPFLESLLDDGKRLLESLPQISEYLVMMLLRLCDRLDDYTTYAAVRHKYPSLNLSIEPMREIEMLYLGAQDDSGRSVAIKWLSMVILPIISDIRIRFKDFTSEGAERGSMINKLDIREKLRDMFGFAESLGDDAVKLLSEGLRRGVTLCSSRTGGDSDQVVDSESSFNNCLMLWAITMMQKKAGESLPTWAIFLNRDVFIGKNWNSWQNYSLMRFLAVETALAGTELTYEYILERGNAYMDYLAVDDDAPDISADEYMESLKRRLPEEFEEVVPELIRYAFEKEGAESDTIRWLLDRLSSYDTDFIDNYPAIFHTLCSCLVDLPEEYDPIFVSFAHNIREMLDFFGWDVINSQGESPEFSFEAIYGEVSTERWDCYERLVVRAAIDMPKGMLVYAITFASHDFCKELIDRYNVGDDAFDLIQRFVRRLIDEECYEDALLISDTPVANQDGAGEFVDDRNLLRAQAYRGLHDYRSSWECRKASQFPTDKDESDYGSDDIPPGYDAVAAILACDYANVEKILDELSWPEFLAVALRCIYMLRVDNAVSEQPIFDTLLEFYNDLLSAYDGYFYHDDEESRYENKTFPLDDDRSITVPVPSRPCSATDDPDDNGSEDMPGDLVECLIVVAWRMLELARYRARHSLPWQDVFSRGRALYDIALGSGCFPVDYQFLDYEFSLPVDQKPV